MAPDKVRIKILLFVLVITMLVLTPILFVCCDKPNIHNVGIEELQEINGLGELLSERIVKYLDNNPNADIDDLTDVKGIGEGKIKLIKERWSD